MKTNYSQLRIWLCALVCMICVGRSTQAQIWSPADPVTVCPGQVGTYTLNGLVAGSRLTGSPAGTVLGGRLLNAPSISSNGSIAFQVQWDDFPFKGNISANIEVPNRDSNGNITGYSLIGSKGFLTALIRSVAFQPGPGGETTVPYCSTTSFPLTIAPQTFLNVPNEQIPAYIWEVPASWGVQGATLIPSFPTTPSNFKVYQGTRNITLTPTPGGDVDLRVFQYSSICNQTYSPTQLYKFLSFPGAFRIRRQPTASITTAPFSVNCGDRTPRTLTATASQSQGLTGFTWNLPSGWTFQGPGNTASVQVIPKGDNGGNITVEANYSCGAPAPTSAPLTVGYTQSVAPVYISLGSSNALYCGTGSVTM